jgi:hypothetical protein
MGQKLQVITKIVEYELGPGETHEGMWHVEGIPDEEIVATAMYFLHCGDDIKGGNILFQRAFHGGDERRMEYFHDRHPKQDEITEKGLVPLSQVETLTNRMLVFPNSHVNKVTKIQNNVIEEDSEKDQKISNNESTQPQKKKICVDVPSESISDSNITPNEKQKRRIVTFFLVNPEKRIISTREVKPQQKEAGGSMNRGEAMKHRLDLMKERTSNKQDWNVRDFYIWGED